ncbi:MAG: N-acetylmannosamine-6-phosphate 2-epimerase [Chthonomonadales bacterium]
MLNNLRGGLIVSCQAAPGSPMDRPDILAAFAQCAINAGAVAIRGNHGINIAAIRAITDLPIIGLKKRDIANSEVYITPEWQDVLEVVEAGTNIIAIDATLRPRPIGFAEMVQRIRTEFPNLLVMADCATHADGIAAFEAGADIVSTTMAGYTTETMSTKTEGPDLQLIHDLRLVLPDAFLVCEGRVHSPEFAKQALAAGADSVVVGTAITAPEWITSQFVKAIQ